MQVGLGLLVGTGSRINLTLCNLMRPITFDLKHLYFNSSRFDLNKYMAYESI